jgi:nucleoside-diphosphate-sugar epimerase
MSTPSVALVLGATGVTGTPLAEQLLISGWRVYGVSRRPPLLKPTAPASDFVHLPVDLQDPTALQAALRAHPDIAHIFDCANIGVGAARLQPMTNLLDAVEISALR